MLQKIIQRKWANKWAAKQFTNRFSHFKWRYKAIYYVYLFGIRYIHFGGIVCFFTVELPFKMCYKFIQKKTQTKNWYSFSPERLYYSIFALSICMLYLHYIAFSPINLINITSQKRRRIKRHLHQNMCVDNWRLSIVEFTKYPGCHIYYWILLGIVNVIKCIKMKFCSIIYRKIRIISIIHSYYAYFSIQVKLF